MSLPHSSRFSTTIEHRVPLGLGGEAALERHEQPRLEALRRLEQRRDDRAVLERHAEQVRDQVRDLGDLLRPARRRRRRPGSCRGSRRILADDEPEPRGQRARDRTIRVRVLVRDRRSARSTFGCLVSTRAASSLDDPALAHAGLADDHREAEVAVHRTRDRRAPAAARSQAARPVNRGRRSYALPVTIVRSPSPSPKSAGSNAGRAVERGRASVPSGFGADRSPAAGVWLIPGHRHGDMARPIRDARADAAP